MGNGSYDHHPHHLHHQTFHHRNQNSATFLPMLCRVSVKDAVNQPRRICPKKDDPSSPKVSCIGQVKKRHNSTTNKLINPFPTPFSASASATKSSAAAAKHSKLRKIFSGKNLLTTGAANTTSGRISTSKETVDRRRPPNYITSSEIHQHGHDISAGVAPLNLNLAELDPPLPVVKRVAQPCGAGGEEGMSLWKRRSGGAGLKGLQIQLFQLQNNNSTTSTHFLSPTTV